MPSSRVVRNFFRSWSKCPFSIANVIPKSVLKLILRIPGHDKKLPFAIALSKVAIAGEKTVACRYLAKSVLDFSFVIM